MKGTKYLSSCSIDSKEGGEYVTDNGIHQDCSKCAVPHSESYIRRNFSRDWFEVMEDVLP
jgi:Zn-finger protein